MDSICDLNARILRRIDVAPDAAIFHIIPNDGPLPSFTSGQYATLGLPWGETAEASNHEASTGLDRGTSHVHSHESRHDGLIKRAYSIASPPSNQKYLEFYIIKVDQGKFTTRLWRLDAGDQIWLSPKIHGHFTLDHVPPTADLLMIATGTGIAPYMSMLREYQGRERWHRVGLIHGVRFAVDLAYREELQSLAESSDDFAYVPTVTREPRASKWSGLRGRIQTLVNNSSLLEHHTGIKLIPMSCHVMLCGNPAMIEETQSILESLQFISSTRGQDGNIHFERYW